MDRPSSRWTGFLAEIRRRHLVRFSLGYAAAAFVALQLAEIVFPAFGISETWVRILVIVVALGFPPATVLAWVFDLTAQGVRRTEGRPEGGAFLPRLAFLAVTVGVVGALGLWLAQQGAFGPDPVEARTATAPASTPYDPTDPVRSLAVLPLQDFSEDRSQEYFTAGMQEELITRLSQIAGLRVVSRTTSARYAGSSLSVPEIGAELGVDAVVEGSVTRDADSVRITVQLIHAPSDAHIWAASYERPLGNVLAMQREVADSIAHNIRDELTEAEELAVGHLVQRDVSPAAEEAYFRGWEELARGTPEGYRSAIGHFDAAIAADSGFARAMAGLAGARFLLGLADVEASSGEFEKAGADAQKALAIDSTSVEAQEVLSLMRRSLPTTEVGLGVLPAAPIGSARVVVPPRVAGMPDSIVIDTRTFDSAWVSASTRLGETIEQEVRRRSIFEGRRTPAGAPATARDLLGGGRPEDVVGTLRGLVADAPESAELWEMLVRAEVTAGEHEAAAASARRWAESGAAGAPSPEAAGELGRAVENAGARGYWSWALPRLEERADSGERVSATSLAAGNAALGNVEDAIDYLYQALAQGDRMIVTIRFDPAFDTLRADPRFTQIARQVQALRTGVLRRPPQRQSPR